MAPRTPPHSCNRPSRRPRSRRDWRGPLHAAWPYLLAAAMLLAASELLWLWHSWPVREILATEPVVAEGSL